MKKLVISMWLLMLSMVATAQTFVIKDKNGNRITYDVSKIEKVTFQDNPPAFTVFEEKEERAQSEEPVIEQITYLFEEVESLAGAPDFLFSHPDTVYVGGETESFRFQLRTNVAYDFKVSNTWLGFSQAIAGTDSLQFVADMNPSTTQRVGYIAFESGSKALRDTLWVVQAGKYDSRYIAIDWTTTSLDSFNPQTGEAKLTFTGEVPVMGDYDVVLLPQDGELLAHRLLALLHDGVEGLGYREAGAERVRHRGDRLRKLLVEPRAPPRVEILRERRLAVLPARLYLYAG